MMPSLLRTLFLLLHVVLQKSDNTFFEIAVGLALFDPQRFARDRADASATCNPLLKRFLLKPMPVRRLQRTRHQLAVNRATELFRRVDQGPRCDLD